MLQPDSGLYTKAQALQQALQNADTIILGAGAGLSSAAGFLYSGERFLQYFSDFADHYHFRDMYSGGFYPYETLEEYWAYWSRYIYINRYTAPPRPLYDTLYSLIRDKDYFVITTNVDHCFQRAGFDKERLFYTQGDYGLFQCSEPCHTHTYDNEQAVRDMLLAQGYSFGQCGELIAPKAAAPQMQIPTDLVPRCPKCGKPMSMNLRADNSFVQDAGWYQAAERYRTFLTGQQNTNVLFLELGVGLNTPGIIKYPFRQMTAENPKAVYICVNYGEAVCPKGIEGQSICLNEDIGWVLQQIRN